MAEFYFETLETTGILRFLNFNERASFPGLHPADEHKGAELDISLYRYEKESEIKKVYGGKVYGSMKNSGRGSYCRFSDPEKGKTFCFFEKTVPVEFMIYQGINKAFVSFQENLNIMFLHTAAVIIDEKMYLFFAPSGGGKTTICSLAEEKGFNVLTDESCVIKKKDDRFSVGLFPVWPVKDGPGKMWEISGIFFLEKAKINKVSSLSAVDAVRRMFPEATCFNNKLIPEAAKADYRRNVFNFLSSMFEKVDFGVLSFKIDTEVFSCIS